MTTRRKIPHSRVAISGKDGLIERDWYLLLERDQHVGVPATSALAGSASALPATPSGYLTVTVNGEQKLMPYYDPP